MKAVKYEKVDKLPDNAVKVSIYAESIGQRHPAYIQVMYDRFLAGKGSNPGYTIINFQGSNFVVPN